MPITYLWWSVQWLDHQKHNTWNKIFEIEMWRQKSGGCGRRIRWLTDDRSQPGTDWRTLTLHEGQKDKKERKKCSETRLLVKAHQLSRSAHSCRKSWSSRRWSCLIPLPPAAWWANPPSFIDSSFPLTELLLVSFNDPPAQVRWGGSSSQSRCQLINGH